MTTEEEDFDEITLEEDMYFSKLADKRLEEAKNWIKHEDFWVLLLSLQRLKNTLGVISWTSRHC
ncbi:hypothetical protein [Rickettsia endosymbiont of Gonocerus acuteangulatus]|uniref:hypothetical protein n=1 Tax=Rickettsia endosymbiont of Gonocerus acuteangulatus TaxID=3066266 RepID=UPI0031333D25